MSGSNDETNSLKQVYFSCNIAGIEICNYIQRSSGNSFISRHTNKSELPNLKIDWRGIFREALLLEYMMEKLLLEQICV